jgi:agmatine/peptidylarginine deiminase
MAEWEELQGILITWTSQQAILKDIVKYAQTECKVYIVCSDSNSVRNYLSSNGVPIINISFLLFPFNSIWIRDYGPWSVYSEGSDSLFIIDWIYNRPRPLDDNIPFLFANNRSLPIYQTTVAPYDLVHTGGNFMTDGLGTGFSSKLILNENTSKTESQIDNIMNLYMGIDRYIKMNNLPYDGIHHIDMHMKLLDEETLLIGQYPPGVADGPYIEQNLQYILNNFLTPFNKPYRIVRIPMPPDQYGRYPDNGGYYRTFTNSIIINKTVIIPTYDLQYDTTAFRIYRQAMPGYRIVGINSNSIIPSNGAIHCIVKEFGVFNPLQIFHSRLDDTLYTTIPYQVSAIVKNQSGISQVNLFWTTDTTSGYSSVPMNLLSDDKYIGFIPPQNVPTDVYYYISATSNNGKTITKPITAPQGYYKFFAANPLPVELVAFIADAGYQSVSLFWETASETNNLGFEVQRRTNEWQTIGFVTGNGTSTERKSYSFTDDQLAAGKYQYRLKQIDYNGDFKLLNEIEVEVMPVQFSLEQNYPNPFNPTTKIAWNSPAELRQTIKVYDLLGNELQTLVDEIKSAGKHEIIFNAENFSSGIYYYKLTAGNFTSIKKMVLIK